MRRKDLPFPDTLEAEQEYFGTFRIDSTSIENTGNKLKDYVWIYFHPLIKSLYENLFLYPQRGRKRKYLNFLKKIALMTALKKPKPFKTKQKPTLE